MVLVTCLYRFKYKVLANSGCLCCVRPFLYEQIKKNELPMKAIGYIQIAVMSLQ